jgi:hypothetical protein
MALVIIYINYNLIFGTKTERRERERQNRKKERELGH